MSVFLPYSLLRTPAIFVQQGPRDRNNGSCPSSRGVATAGAGVVTRHAIGAAAAERLGGSDEGDGRQAGRRRLGKGSHARVLVSLLLFFSSRPLVLVNQNWV